MRDPNRIDRILGLLGARWKQHPDLRLGQIIHNLGYEAKVMNNCIAPDSDMFYVEDDLMESALIKELYEPKQSSKESKPAS